MRFLTLMSLRLIAFVMLLSVLKNIFLYRLPANWFDFVTILIAAVSWQLAETIQQGRNSK
jgi:hypothetical protein